RAIHARILSGLTRRRRATSSTVKPRAGARSRAWRRGRRSGIDGLLRLLSAQAFTFLCQPHGHAELRPENVSLGQHDGKAPADGFRIWDEVWQDDMIVHDSLHSQGMTMKSIMIS